MEKELKPCPFCGKESPKILHRDLSQFVYCEECGSMGGEFSLLNPLGKGGMIKAWNIRANEKEEKIQKQRDEAIGLLSQMCQVFDSHEQSLHEMTEWDREQRKSVMDFNLRIMNEGVIILREIPAHEKVVENLTGVIKNLEAVLLAQSLKGVKENHLRNNPSDDADENERQLQEEKLR